MTTPIIIGWFEDIIPPNPLEGSPEPFQHRVAVLSRSEWGKLLGGLATGGQVSYFKLGEGGWIESEEISEVDGQGSGTFIVSGTVSGPPLIPGSVTVDVGLGRYATDVPNTPYDGTGVLNSNGDPGEPIGSIIYKTGAYSATFQSIVTNLHDITVTRRHRGEIRPVAEDAADGSGIAGPYTATLKYSVRRRSLRITDAAEPPQVLVDDGSGVLSGDGSGTIDYETGDLSVTFTAPVDVGWYVRAEYDGVGIPVQPEEGMTALAADSDSTLATYTKMLDPSSDMAFQGAGTATVRVTLGLLTGEGNDDGFGYSPFWTEGALFSANDVLLLYFTMAGISKSGSNTWTRQLDLAVRV